MGIRKWKSLLYFVVYFLFLVTLSVFLMGQNPQIQPHIPTKKQYQELYKQRAKVYKVQQKMADLQTQQGFETQEFLKKCDEIIMENRWSKDLRCDFQTFNFVIPYQPPPNPPVKPANPEPTPPAKEK